MPALIPLFGPPLERLGGTGLKLGDLVSVARAFGGH